MKRFDKIKARLEEVMGYECLCPQCCDARQLGEDIRYLIARVEALEEALKFYADAEEYPPKEMTEQYNTPHLKMIVFDFGATAREALADEEKK